MPNSEEERVNQIRNSSPKRMPGSRLDRETGQIEETQMARRSYQNKISGSTALILAALHLRDLARLEFLYDLNSREGVLLSQLALDLRKIADGSSINCTAVWRAFAAQYPRFFRAKGCEVHLVESLKISKKVGA